MTDNKKVGETSSGEVVNGFRSCRDLSDIVPLYAARGIYLKPIAKINVSINLPQLKTPGKTISTWEVMEKLRLLIRPDEFVSLKVVKSTLEFLRFEGDLGDKSRLQQVLARLDGQRMNLAGFPNVLKVKAAEIKDDFPTRHSWDSYFRDARHMNELKAGERPDTIHISGLPVKWFSEDDGKTPSEPLVAKVFKRWGVVKRVDVPAADLYRSRMRLGKTLQKFSYEEGIFFDAFIQYVEYMDFVKAMDALRGMKLLKKEKDKNHIVAAVKVDFDKTKHMSDNSVSHRDFERKRLIAQDNLAAEKLRRKEEAEAKRKEEMKKKKEIDSKEKDSRRRMREEKRKRKALTSFRKKEEDIVSMKIAREERKLIEALRELESIRLLDALFDRIKIKAEKNEIDLKLTSVNDKEDKTDGKTENNSKEETNKKIKKKVKKDKKKKKTSKKKKNKTSDEDSDEAETNNKKSNPTKTTNDPFSPANLPLEGRYFPPWFNTIPMLPPHALYRGFPRGRNIQSSRFRPGRGRGRQYYPHIDPQEYNEMYYEYFSSLVGQDFLGPVDNSLSNLRSKTQRSRSRSKSRRRRNSRSRTRSPVGSNSKKRTRSKSKSRSRSRGRSRSRKRYNSRDRSKNNSSKSRPRARTKSYSRSRSRTRKTSSARRQQSYSNNKPRSRVRVTRARSRTASPKRRSRSSSWSLPKSPRSRSCSWSKTADESSKKTDKVEKCKNDEEESLTPKEKRKEDKVDDKIVEEKSLLDK